MMHRPAIGHFLALLAMVGLMVAPLVHSAMAMPAADHVMQMAGATVTAGMEMAGVAEEMPCCPRKMPLPDWGSDCPFMALCSAMLINPPVASLTVPLTAAGVMGPGDQSDLVSVTLAPPRRPPKL
jgi:hypothetical protein